MNNLFHKQVSLTKGLFASLIVFVGYFGLFYGPPIIGLVSLSVSSLIGIAIIFGSEMIPSLFSKPIQPVKNTLKYLVLSAVVSMSIGTIVTVVFGFQSKANPINAPHVSPLLFVIVPITVMGEELFSMYFLSLFSSKFSLPVANILSAIIFGLIHYSTYYNGNMFTTLLHIVLIQGTTRLLLNQAAIKSNSIWTSWIVHAVFDVVPMVLIFLAHQ